METKKPGEICALAHMGRCSEKDGELILYWTGSGADFTFKGSEIYASFNADYEANEPWILVEADGAVISRIPMNKGENKLLLLRGLNPADNHRIRIFRDTQAIQGDESQYLSLSSLTYEGEILPPPKAKYTLEFVGDSITSGEGTYGAIGQMDWLSAYMGLANNYTRKTASILGADFRVISQSGWGVVTDWRNCPDCALPKFYDKVCGVTDGKKNIEAGAHELYDFDEKPASAVIVNLGTNDDGAFHGEEWIDPVMGVRTKQELGNDGRPAPIDDRRFIDAVKDFVKKIRHLNKDAWIIWAYGMIGDFLAPEIATAINEYRAESGDEKAEFFKMPNSEAVGSREHPGPESHAKAAEALAAELRRLLSSQEGGEKDS